MFNTNFKSNNQLRILFQSSYYFFTFSWHLAPRGGGGQLTAVSLCREYKQQMLACKL